MAELIQNEYVCNNDQFDLALKCIRNASYKIDESLQENERGFVLTDKKNQDAWAVINYALWDDGSISKIQMLWGLWTPGIDPTGSFKVAREIESFIVESGASILGKSVNDWQSSVERRAHSFFRRWFFQFIQVVINKLKGIR